MITLQPSVPLSAKQTLGPCPHTHYYSHYSRNNISGVEFLKRFVKFLQGSEQCLPGGLAEDRQNPCKIIHYITHLISSGHKLYVLQQSGDIKLRQSSAE